MSVAIMTNVVVSAWSVSKNVWRLEQRVEAHNLISSSGLEFCRDFFSGSRTRPNYIAIGSGTTSAMLTDTELETETFRKLISRRFPETARVTFQMLLDQSEANSTTIAEIGLFADSTLLARALISPAIAKTAAIFATISHEWTFANG